MSAVVEQIGTDPTTMRPFRVDVPEAELTELRQRIKSARLPEKEPVADMSHDYDWRRSEATVPQKLRRITIGNRRNDRATLGGLTQFLPRPVLSSVQTVEYKGDRVRAEEHRRRVR
jgi:hypothetical protein